MFTILPDGKERCGGKRMSVYSDLIMLDRLIVPEGKLIGLIHSRALVSYICLMNSTPAVFMN